VRPSAVLAEEDFVMKKLIFLLLFPMLVACSTEGELQKILGKNAEVPIFLGCRPVSSKEMIFNFSHSVQILSLGFDPALETESIEEGADVRVTFANPLKEGVKVTADIIVEDSGKNTLNVIVPFRTRNDRMPALVFNELRTEYSKPKVEFVEFLALEAGNLGAMRLLIAGYSLTKPAYEFSPAEVKAGEYIVLHLRTVEEGCVDETGQNLALSGGTDAQENARDFWIPGNAKLLHKTDALWLMDQDDRIIDAVLLSESSDAAWSGKGVAEAVEFLGRKKAWLPASGDGKDNWLPTPADAVISSGTTNTRTICRDETIPPQRRARNWYITATSSATPGKANNPKRYTPK
jgi:hypothetical protein